MTTAESSARRSRAREAIDDSCELRKLAYDGVTFTAETATPSASSG